jgi:O-antigen/teichoic acid export membrane protein
MQDAARATTGRSVLRGGLWYVASYGVPQAYTLVISIVAARFLGPEGMGRQSFIAFVSLTVTSVLSSAMYVALMRFIGETAGRGQSELLPGLLWWAWRIEAVAAVLAAGALAAVAATGARPTGAWALAAVVSAAGVLHTVPTAVLIGLQRFRDAAVVGLATGLVSTAAVTIVLWQGGGITGMFAVEAAVGMVNLAWTGTLARRRLGAVSGAGADPEQSRRLRRAVVNYALLSSVGVVLEMVVATRSEFFFLAHYSSDSQIAFYSIAFSAVTALRLIPRGLGGSIAPAFATLYGAGAWDRIRNGYSRAFRFLLFVSLPVTAVMLALGQALVRVVYGGGYRGVGHPLQIVFAVFPLVAVGALGNSLLAGLGRVRMALVVTAVAAAVDVGLAAGLIPSLDAVGAAIANAAAQATYALIVLVFSARLLGRPDWRPLTTLRRVVASAGAGAAGWICVHVLGDVAGLLAGVPAALVVFGLMGWGLRIMPADDARWIDDALGSKLFGAVGRLARLWSERERTSPGPERP